MQPDRRRHHRIGGPLCSWRGLDYGTYYTGRMMSRLLCCSPTTTTATSLADGALERITCSRAGRSSALTTTLLLGVCMCSRAYLKLATCGCD